MSGEDEVVRGLVKQKHARPNKREQLVVHADAGENTRYLNHSIQIFNMPEIDTDDGEQVMHRVVEYFELCAGNDMKPNLAGLALALGTSRQQLYRWENGVESNKPEGVRFAIKRAKAVLNAQMEDYMQNGKINPVSGIFIMKNNMGYSDQQEVIFRPQMPLGEEKNAEQIALEYCDLPED